MCSLAIGLRKVVKNGKRAHTRTPPNTNNSIIFCTALTLSNGKIFHEISVKILNKTHSQKVAIFIARMELFALRVLVCVRLIFFRVIYNDKIQANPNRVRWSHSKMLMLDPKQLFSGATTDICWFFFSSFHSYYFENSFCAVVFKSWSYRLSKIH